MRRLSAWLIAVVVVVALLTACGGDEVEDRVAEQPTSRSSTTAGSEGISAEPAAPATEHATPNDEQTMPDGETPTGPMTVTYRPGTDFEAVAVGGVVVGVDNTVWAVLEGDAAESNQFHRAQYFARFDPDGWVEIGAPDPSALTNAGPSHVYDMDVEGGPDASLWLISTGPNSVSGVYLHSGDSWTAPAGDAVDVTTGAAAPDGSLWTLAVAGPAGPIELRRFTNGTVDEHLAPPGGIDCIFCVVYEVDRNNVLWMASQTGLVGFDGETWTELPGTAGGAIGGLGAGERLWVLGVDGSHWFLGATETGGVGLTRVSAAESTTLPLDISTVEVDSACLADLGTMTPADSPLDEVSLALGVRGIAGDAAGGFWLAVECVGLFHIDVDSGVTTPWSIEDGLPSLHFRSVAAHPDGSLWVATSDGITHIVADVTTHRG